MKRAIYPGSFDPITLGHLDVIERARAMCDELTVAVAVNADKKPLFSVEERAALIRESLPEGSPVRVLAFDGLLVELARRESTFILIRGLRAVSDFEFEFQLALMNRRLHPGLETVFLTPKEDLTFISSRLVKEVASHKGDVSPFVSEPVLKALKAKFSLD